MADLRSPEQADAERPILIDAEGSAERGAAGNCASFRTEILPTRAAEPLRGVFVPVHVYVAAEDRRSVARNRRQAVGAAVTDHRCARSLCIVKIWDLKEPCPDHNRPVIRHRGRNHVDHAGRRESCLRKDGDGPRQDE